MSILRIDVLHHLHGGEGLGLTHIPSLVNNLTMQIGEIDGVEIDDADVADARRREVGEDRRAQSAGADDNDARGLELLLPLQRHLRHDEMASVTADLFIGKGHVLVGLVDAGNETHGERGHYNLSSPVDNAGVCRAIKAIST